MSRERVGVAEALGITPLRERWPQVRLALRGDASVPPSRFGTSSLRLLRPWLSLQLWAGRAPWPRRAVVTNLFNHRPTPVEEGWSVRRTQVLDFRGRGLTYDSHNGTDFSVPPGTVVVAAAPGRVVRVTNDFNRGGLKVVLDHGDGLVTTSNHLARVLVGVGERVARGQRIALSGMSGLDGLLSFPWTSPHVHYNVWHDGAPCDPFAREGEASMWRAGARPEPLRGPAPEEPDAPADLDPAAVDRAVDACRDDAVRATLRALPPDERGHAVMFEMNYYPTRFRERPALYRTATPRRPRLDLPFGAEDWDGVVFVDDPA